MKDAMIKFFESEYKETEHLLKTKPTWIGTPISVVHSAIQRCLGVAQFAQTCPGALSYEEIEIHYEKVRKNLENLLTTYS